MVFSFISKSSSTDNTSKIGDMSMRFGPLCKLNFSFQLMVFKAYSVWWLLRYDDVSFAYFIDLTDAHLEQGKRAST